ncbi:tumor necrosis factor (ligand) superfamily, member 10 like 4 [Salminus brasiliensis]|uniref:tumor necrosis factor (ligand) superfamily, member 10 like 4 n=1 Tax=Salminus brasiliensis TaxID=930266 RepID=UPI003B82CDB8
MTADIQTKAGYNDLKEDSGGSAQSGRWGAYFLILSLVLAVETFITACFLYDFASDIHTTDESLRQGLYPTDCLYHFTDEDEVNGGGMASCELMKKEFQNSAHQRLLLDIQNSLWQSLGEHNVTQIFKPAIHLGAKQELKQYQYLQKTGDPEAVALALERLNWEALSGQSSQEGLMRLSPDGEIVVPQDGIYFVYSQVYFESAHSGRDLQVMQYLFKRTDLHPELTVLAKAAATQCLNSESGVGLYSSHQGALFHLERGDRLALYVRNMGAVHFPPEATYFGAFMID